MVEEEKIEEKIVEEGEVNTQINEEEMPETFEDLIKSFLDEEEREEEEVENKEMENKEKQPTELATETHKQAKERVETRTYTCPICGREFTSLQAYAAHMRWHKEAEKKKAKEAKARVESEEIMEEGEEGEGGWYLPDSGDEPIIRSPKEELEHWFISQLANRLPLAVGEKRAKIIIETLKEDPDVIWDPQLLKVHIMQLAPTNVNKYLLDWILRVLYKQLESKKKNIEESYGFMFGSVSPPEERGYLMPSIRPPKDELEDFGSFRSRSRISPPRMSFDREAFEDHFEDYEYKRRPRRKFYEDEDFDFMPSFPRSNGESETTKAILDLLAKLIDEIKSIKESKPPEPLVEVPAPDGSGVIRAPPSMVPFILQMYKEKAEKKKEPEPYVELPNPYGEGVIRVPASLAPKYMEMFYGKKEKEKAKEPMVDVPNPFGQGTLKVPASLAPVYIELAKLQKEKESDKSEPTVEIPNPNGTGTIKVPASLAPVYMSLLELTKAVKEIKEKKPEEKKIKVFTEEGKFIEMSPEEAIYYMQLQAEKEKQKQLEQTVRNLQSQIEKMYSVLHPKNVTKLLEELGYAKQGSPTLALLNSARQDMNKIADRLFSLAEMQMKNQMALYNLPKGSQGSTVGPMMTPEERKEKIEKLKKGISLAQQIAEIEKEIKTSSQRQPLIEVVEGQKTEAKKTEANKQKTKEVAKNEDKSKKEKAT